MEETGLGVQWVARGSGRGTGKGKEEKKRGFSAVFPQRANMERYDHEKQFM
jgi:hypothetical protein